MDQEMNQQSGTEALAVCPRKKKDKKPVVFYADRMVFNDETILYKDIESVSSAYSSVIYNGIFHNLPSLIEENLAEHEVGRITVFDGFMKVTSFIAKMF